MEDIWDDDDDDYGGGGMNNLLKMNVVYLFSRYQYFFVWLVVLCGMGWDGLYYQELMIEFGQIILIMWVQCGYFWCWLVLFWILCNNGQDIFQIGVLVSKYNMLVQCYVSYYMIICWWVLQVFGEVCRFYLSYDKGNCWWFVQDIFEVLVLFVIEDFEKEFGGCGSNMDEIRDLFF